jgi:hypothetical protein
MKTRFSGLLAALAVLVFLFTPAFSRPADPAPATLAMSQDDPAPVPVEVDPNIVTAILALVSGGIASLITQIVKKALKLKGVGAGILTAVACIACTGIYFLIIAPMHPFQVLPFALYVFVVFGEATGYYHFGKLFTNRA